MRFAEEEGLGVDRMEDIILVTGRHLARSWVRAVFSDSRGGAQVTFIARVSGASNVHLEERNVSGAQLELGPRGQVGFAPFLRLPTVLRNHGLIPRVYRITNAYLSEGTTSSAS